LGAIGGSPELLENLNMGIEVAASAMPGLKVTPLAVKDTSFFASGAGKLIKLIFCE